MAKLKVYTPGPRHFVTNEVAEAIGLPKHRQQADLYVAAHTKAEAFEFLADLHLAPSSVHDSEFRVAMGRTVEVLISYGVLPYAGAIAVTQPHGKHGPVVRVAETGCTPVGKFVRGMFVPGADLVAGGGLTAVPITEAEIAAAGTVEQGSPAAPAAVESYPEESEMLLARLASSARRVPEVERELARVRAEREHLCLRAVELGLAEQAARELDVTPGRVYQMKDKALRAHAEKGELLPGLKVQADGSGDRSSWPVGEIVPAPADDENGTGGSDFPAAAGWVWIRDLTNGSVYPAKAWRVRAAVPSCTVCPVEEAPYGLSPAQQYAHDAVKHGVR